VFLPLGVWWGMQIRQLSYEEAVERHPEQVQAIITKLRKSRSKSKGTAPEAMKWSYECSVTIEGSGRLDQVLSASQRIKSMSTEEQIADEVRRTHTALSGSAGRWGWSESVPNPPEVEERVRARFREREEDQKKMDQMSPEEREESFQATLGAFFGGGGVALTMGGGGRAQLSRTPEEFNQAQQRGPGVGALNPDFDGEPETLNFFGVELTLNQQAYPQVAFWEGTLDTGPASRIRVKLEKFPENPLIPRYAVLVSFKGETPAQVFHMTSTGNSWEDLQERFRSQAQEISRTLKVLCGE